jgi:outer membrane protein assembly factor BamB
VGGTWGNPAYANGVIYYHGEGDFLKAFSISNGFINPVPIQSGARFGYPGATPSVSSNGAANGIVWEIQRGNPEVLYAFDAANVARMLYNSSQNAARDGLNALPTTTVSNPQKFMTPTIADGHVFVGTDAAQSAVQPCRGRAGRFADQAHLVGQFQQRERLQDRTIDGRRELRGRRDGQR